MLPAFNVALPENALEDELKVWFADSRDSAHQYQAIAQIKTYILKHKRSSRYDAGSAWQELRLYMRNAVCKTELQLSLRS